MRDPLHWTLPFGRLFGVRVRLHVMLPLIALGLVLREISRKDAPADIGIVVAAVMGLAFLSILLHELGHLLVARLVGGDCEEFVLWPLGGLTPCDVPHTPRASFLASLGGPAVNFAICLLCGAWLAGLYVLPPLNPFSATAPFYPSLDSWTGAEIVPTWHANLAARLFWINWVILLFNLVPAYPLDAAPALHSILWSRTDYREALSTTAYVGFGGMLCLFVLAIFRDNALMLALVIVVYLSCRAYFVHGESGGEDSTMGYDFSQGFSSFERGATAPPRRPEPNFLKRWFQRRAAKRALEEQHQREIEELRMDELLEKVQERGLSALSEEERRFLNRVSARYRSK